LVTCNNILDHETINLWWPNLWICQHFRGGLP